MPRSEDKSGPGGREPPNPAELLAGTMETSGAAQCSSQEKCSIRSALCPEALPSTRLTPGSSHASLFKPTSQSACHKGSPAGGEGLKCPHLVPASRLPPWPAWVSTEAQEQGKKLGAPPATPNCPQGHTCLSTQSLAGLFPAKLFNAPGEQGLRLPLQSLNRKWESRPPSPSSSCHHVGGGLTSSTPSSGSRQ